MRDAEGPDWAAVERDYVGNRYTVRAICAKYEISLDRLYRRVAVAGWPRRQKAQARPRPRPQAPGGAEEAAAAGGVAGQGEDDTRARAGGLIVRLFEALERQMRDIEHRLNGGEPGRVPADRERDARTLASLVRTLEKLFELERVNRSGGESPGGGGKPDADRLRQALARRIARLAGQGDD